MPVYQLLGGKCREAVDPTRTRAARRSTEVVDSARKFMARGFRHVRVQVGVPGMAGYGSRRGGGTRVPALHDGSGIRTGAVHAARARSCSKPARKELGDEVELLHDMHERVLAQSGGAASCKDVEQFKLFFLEDPLSPEDIE